MPSLDLEGRRRGRYFTPGPLAAFVVERAAARVPAGPLAVIDPACGAGALLAQAAKTWPGAQLLGIDLSSEAVREAHDRVPRATLLEGNALEDVNPLAARIPEGAFELWLANPPYNGTSPVLHDPALYARLQQWLPTTLAKGLSLRDDFAFFLLLARRRLLERRGALAFITPATLLDAFAYGPLREALLESLTLEEVVEVGPGAFADTKVRTCLTFWTAPKAQRLTTYRSRAVAGPFSPAQLSAPTEFRPQGPEWLLRPVTQEALELDAAWRREGEPLSALIPVSFPGLKTRFDELLVDEDEERLLNRIRAFLNTPAARLPEFAGEWAIPQRCLDKLGALHASALRLDVQVDARFLRPFVRYAGAKHRGVVPESAAAFCYLDRRLIPRGDHRLHGEYDPHACSTKLVFNARELPLSAAMVRTPACVHNHRHARFAPLEVPARILEVGLKAPLRGDLGAAVPNLSPRGRAWADSAGGPAAVFQAVCDFINSDPVQRVWAPAFGASRTLHVPVPLTGAAG